MQLLQESVFLGVIISDSSSGRETVLLNLCFWKNRRLERVGRSRQDVDWRAAGLGAGAGRPAAPGQPLRQPGLEVLAPVPGSNEGGEELVEVSVAASLGNTPRPAGLSPLEPGGWDRSVQTAILVSCARLG